MGSLVLTRRLVLLLHGFVLVGACGGGDTRVCFGTHSFCRDGFGTNRPPEAHAGPDFDVVSGERTTLDGSESRDVDGHITSYSWTQESGPVVALSQATTSIATFDAPEVEESTTLAFRLVVTDDDGASDADSVSVTVMPGLFGALGEDLEWLQSVPPQPCPDEAVTPQCWSYLGLWLGAGVSAAAAMPDLDATELLDALRVIQITRPGEPPEDLPTPVRQVFDLGLRAVAEFTEQRDPASAQRARQLAPGPAPRIDDWRAAIDALNEVSPPGRNARRAASVLLRALEQSHELVGGEAVEQRR